MTVFVHPVQGGVQGGVQGRNPRRHWLVQGGQGASLHVRTRTSVNLCVITYMQRAPRTRIPLHTLHTLHNVSATRATRVHGGVQGYMYPARPFSRTRAIPLSQFSESEGRGASL